MTKPDTQTRRRALASCAIAGAAALLLAGCSSGSAASSSGGGSTGTAGGGGGGVGSGNGAARFGGANAPAASGLIAAISGSTVQVQDRNAGQTAVTVTSATQYTQTVATSLSAVKAGMCVVATAASSSAPTSAPAAAPTAITATSVVVMAPVNGVCGRGGFGGGFGTRPPGSRTAFPTTLPSGAQPGGGFRPGTVRGFGDIVSGKVTSVAGSSIAVAEPARGSSGASGSTTPATVTVTAATTYTTTESATKAALVVGKCMTAFGKADTTGAVTATRVALSTAGPNGCSTGFGFGRGRFGGSPTTGG